MGSTSAPLLEQLASFALETRHSIQRTHRCRNEPLQTLLSFGKREASEIRPVQPQNIEGGVGQRSPTPHQTPEINPAITVGCHDLTVQDEACDFSF